MRHLTPALYLDPDDYHMVDQARHTGSARFRGSDRRFAEVLVDRGFFTRDPNPGTYHLTPLGRQAWEFTNDYPPIIADRLVSAPRASLH